MEAFVEQSLVNPMINPIFYICCLLVDTKMYFYNQSLFTLNDLINQ
jgi:hypothetical protein